MGTKHSKSASSFNIKQQSSYKSSHVSADKLPTTTEPQLEFGFASRSSDWKQTQDTSIRCRNTFRRNSMAETQDIQVKKPLPVEKIDVRTKLQRIKRKPRGKLDLKKTETKALSSPLYNGDIRSQAPRSDLVAGSFTLESFQDTDPYTYFQFERFGFKRNLADKPIAKKSRMAVVRSRFGSEDYSRRPVTTGASLMNDLFTSARFLQKSSTKPEVKDSIVVHRKEEEPLPPQSPKPLIKPLCSDTRYRMRRQTTKLRATKTEDSANSTDENPTHRQSKAEKQWQWKGSYGTLRVLKRLPS